MTKFIVTFMLATVTLLSGCTRGDALPPEAVTDNSVISSLAVRLPVIQCSELSSVDITSIGGAGSVVTSAGVAEQSSGSVCIVEGTLAPEIGFKVQLPLTSWTQRYMQLGCGGLCGRVGLMAGASDGCMAVDNNNFVLASSDMGHKGGSGDFGHDPQKRIDFAYRAMHLTSVVAKALINEFYGQDTQFSYFNGCSDGGREALMEAQRFPDDFDGIIAGAPAMNFSVQNSFHHGWLALSNRGKDGNAILHAEKMPLLHQAALDLCDEIDGLKDDLIQDPRDCHFDPKMIQCEQGQATDNCLTEEEVKAAAKIYAGPHDAQTGKALALGAPMPGSELSWPGVFVPQAGSEDIFSKRVAEEALRGVIYAENPEHFQLSDLRFTEAEFNKVRELYGLYSAVDPDLNAFNAQGGKLILWHGWSDPHISPVNSIAYYEAVEKLMGKRVTDNFMKFYLFPGMYHCSGGDGPYQFDLTTAIMRWVEQGMAPDEIIASQSSEPIRFNAAGAPEAQTGDEDNITNNETAIDRSRPVYPYPNIAFYKGTGSINSARNFESKRGVYGPDSYDWVGAEYYQPGKTLTCEVTDNKLTCSPSTDK